VRSEEDYLSTMGFAHYYAPMPDLTILTETQSKHDKIKQQEKELSFGFPLGYLVDVTWNHSPIFVTPHFPVSLSVHTRMQQSVLLHGISITLNITQI
jgi:hypothetical protein